MEQQNSWVFFKDIDFLDKKFNQFSIYTRDFHCGYKWEEDFKRKVEKDYNKIEKNSKNFFHTEEELKGVLTRFYDESGGLKEWRFFSLIGYGENWQLKYLRIFRTELGFLICDDNYFALNKEILQKSI